MLALAYSTVARVAVVVRLTRRGTATTESM